MEIKREQIIDTPKGVGKVHDITMGQFGIQYHVYLIMNHPGSIALTFTEDEILALNKKPNLDVNLN